MRLGIAGGMLAGAMVIVGTITGIVRVKAAAPVPGVNPLSFLTIPLGDMLVFGILIGAAFYYRRQVDSHKRLMLPATIGILPPAIARLPFAFIAQNGPLAFFGLADLFIVPCLIFDFVTRGRPPSRDYFGGIADHRFSSTATHARRHACVAGVYDLADTLDIVRRPAKNLPENTP